MCGIAGVWRGARQKDDSDVVASMMEALRPRGPDAEGRSFEGPVTLGHTRLAILDLTRAGLQPMVSHTDRFVISYNGEIYNFPDLKTELGLSSATLRSSSDTEVLLWAWERWGPDCPHRLVGPFAFAVYDRKIRRLWLVRDRMGEKPLFYHRDRGVLSFASTIAALFRLPWVGREIDDDALAEYVTLRYVVAPRTIISAIHKLRPGHMLIVDEKDITTRRWWYPPFNNSLSHGNPPSWEEADERFDTLLQQACSRCLNSDVPLGMLLSDGIDSNSIHTIIRGFVANVPTFTFEASAAPGARLSSRNEDGTEGGLHRRWLFHTGEIEQYIDPALSCLSEPVGDGATIATWLLIRNARPDATVFLCGHGGDEVLGGYRLSQDRFRLSVLRWLSRLPLSLSAPVVEYWTHGSGPVSQRRRKFARSSAKDWPAAVPYLIHRPLYYSTVNDLFGARFDPGRFLASIDRLYQENHHDFCDLDRMQYVLLETFLASNILSFADSVSMDSSVELRLPFLDRDLVEFVIGLPRRFRISRWPGRANTKLLLRSWGRERLSRNLVRNRKKSFRYGSIRHLLRSPGRPIQSRILALDALRRRLPGLEGWVTQDQEHFHGPMTNSLWALLTLAVWGRANRVH